MKNKLKYLTKISLNKQIKTKWFLIANIIFFILIACLVNFDSIIKLFGGDFDDETEVLVIDNMDVFNELDEIYQEYGKYLDDYSNVKFSKYDGDYDSFLELLEEDNDKVLLIIDKDEEEYLKAKIVSNDGYSKITETLIKTTLNTIKNNLILKENEIDSTIYDSINMDVEITNEYIDPDKLEDDTVIVTIMQVITLPMFLLITFLVQMIGAEVNEEKSTKSMEIIISNVSPKTHFLSKVLASNLFVLIQTLLLIGYILVGVFLRLIFNSGSLVGDLSSEVSEITSMFDYQSIISSISYMIPIILVMIILTFIAYSLLAGVLASMTTNLEDFQQLQTPIVIISLIGYYLATMASILKGSLFIKIMSFVPFISCMLAPTMYVLGEISIYELLISIVLIILVIYLLIKYGLRIYKVGILNYSGNGLWKKMAKAIREK